MDQFKRVSEQHGPGSPPVGPTAQKRSTRRTGRDVPTTRRTQAIDWPFWLARIERHRRLLRRGHLQSPRRLPESALVRATCNSFRLDGIAVDSSMVLQALSRSPSQRRMRWRETQRIRNHLAILHRIEHALRLGQPLTSAAVVRWYTSIAGGLSVSELGSQAIRRLEQIVRRINSPHLRLQPALQEIARTHAELIADPLFPAFNGILARLILRYHLGRCGLPLVILDPSADPQSLSNESAVLPHLLKAIDETYAAALE